MNQKFFHTKRKVDKNDLNFLKKKIEKMNKKRMKREFGEKEKGNIW